jgi:uncharacterized protein (DUF1800 family)
LRKNEYFARASSQVVFMTTYFQTFSFIDRGREMMMSVAAFALLAPTMLMAAASDCPFDVSRDVLMSSTARAPRFAHDGVLMTRFALGIRGPALYDRLSNDSTRFVGEGNTGSVAGSLDVDGDGVFTVTDATVVSRYAAGFRGDKLVAGITFNASAARKTGVEVNTFIDNGCVVTPAAASMQRHAARLLQQGTYGATLSEINRVAGLGANPNAMTSAWLDEQFAKTRSQFASYAQQLINENKTGNFPSRCDQPDNGCPWAANTPAFYKRAMEGASSSTLERDQDQLRQRVTNALWQTLVVSISNNTVLDAGVGLPDYFDMLSGNVFAGHTTNFSGAAAGNFRKILKDMTLHPAMGVFLDMLGSTREVPNENYPRELLQLFSVGTVMLNQDGTAKRDANGKTIPTYDEDVVKGVSKALTGWHWGYNAGTDGAREAWHFYWAPYQNWTRPMQPWAKRRCPQDGRWPQGSTTDWCDWNNPAKSYPPPHQNDEKKLLSYTQVNNQPAPYSVIAARAEPTSEAQVTQFATEDLERVVDNVFYHPNVAPFISRQLIQRLVTSNPTPGYISRVAAKFNDNGSGVRGDMRAVVRAIYLDNEARDVNIAAKNWFGKLREPVNKFIHLHRAFGARASGGYYNIWDTGSPETLGQSAMRPPSVFNYYSPDFGPSGPLAYSTIRPLDAATFDIRAGEPLLGPEFEITNTSTIAGFSDFWGWGVYRGFNRYESDTSLNWRPDYSRYITGAGALADTPVTMVDELDVLLTAGNLKPAFKANLVAMAEGITRGNVDEQREQRFQAVFWQIVNSADYAVQR